MKSNRYILPVSAVAIAAALIFLVLKVRATPGLEVDDKKLAKAEAAYKRANDEAAAPAATNPVKRDTARSEVVRATPRVNTAPPAPRGDDPPPSGERKTPMLSVATAPKKDLQAKMNAANKAYDKGDYPVAEDAALEILKDHPRNIRMLRIVVSTSCMDENAAQAKEYIQKLPNHDQTQMRTRCSRWGLDLPDPDAE